MSHAHLPPQYAPELAPGANRPQVPRVLSIAGTDPSGGAGLQADLKSFSANGAYGMGAVTALVSQNTIGVRDVHVPPTGFLRSQLDAVSDDVTIDAVKIGMLFDAPIIGEVTDWLGTLRGTGAADPLPGAAAAPLVVLDPVMVATSGDRLLRAEAEEALRGMLRHVDLVTPNIPELAVLAETEPAATMAAAVDQARAIAAEHNVKVLAKGGHLDDGIVADVLVHPDGRTDEFHAPRIDTANTHGTGCSLSAAIAALWPRLGDAAAAVGEAKRWLTRALEHADELNVGRGNGPVHHFADAWARAVEPDPAAIADAWWDSIKDLRDAIDELDFVKGLGDGTLDEKAFRHYLAQDALYLNGYSRAMAAASALAPTQEEQMFWARSADGAIAAEMELHRSFLGAGAGSVAAGSAEAAAPTRAYVDHLVATAARGSYGEVIAAILPCFWLYRDIGRRLIARNHDGHPYGAWLETYADEGFDADTNTAIGICSRHAARAMPEERAAMDRAFRLSSWHEADFFDAPLRES